MGRLNVSTKDYSTELAILDSRGLLGQTKNSNNVERHFAKIMAEVGLEPRSIMVTLSQIMMSGESDGIKLAAVKFATQLWMHPAVVNNKTSEADTRPQINFVVEGSNVQINNILTPQT